MHWSQSSLGTKKYLYYTILLEEWLLYGGIAKVVIDIRAQKTSVPFICDVTSVADPGYKVLERVPGDLLVFIQVQVEQALAHLGGVETKI